MTLTLHTLRSPRGRKRRTRVGRGNASGQGTYAGRGQKGQKARTGGRRGVKRRGLKQFLAQIPKRRGFTSHHPGMMTVNLHQLEKHFRSGDRITLQSLLEKGLIDSLSARVKILGSGKLSKPLTVAAHAFSGTAEQAITKAGGTVMILQ